MNFERIGASHPLFEASFTLYEASFPPNERRTREDHLRALQDADFFPLGENAQGKTNLLESVFYLFLRGILFSWVLPCARRTRWRCTGSG